MLEPRLPLICSPTRASWSRSPTTRAKTNKRRSNSGSSRSASSPTDFIQIKGRGTRKHNFLEQLFDDSLRDGVSQPQKTAFKLFDFFANCEYFEEEFNYDEVLKLPRPTGKGRDGEGGESLVVALAGIGGLAVYMVRRGVCQSCEKGSEVQGWQHVLHRKPANARRERP